MLTEEQKVRIRELKGKGYSKNKAAGELNISWDSVDKFWREGEGKEETPGDTGDGKGKEPVNAIAPGGAGHNLSLKEKYAIFAKRATIRADAEVVEGALAEKLERGDFKGIAESRANLLIEKIEWTKTQLEKVETAGNMEYELNQAQEIYGEIAKECQQLVAIEDPEALLQEIQELKKEYDAVKAMTEKFEKEKGLPLAEVRKFVEENSELVTDWRAMKAEVEDWRAVRWELRALKQGSPEVFEWKCRGCGSLNSRNLGSSLVQAADDGRFYDLPCRACGRLARFTAFGLALTALDKMFDILGGRTWVSKQI